MREVREEREWFEHWKEQRTSKARNQYQEERWRVIMGIKNRHQEANSSSKYEVVVEVKKHCNLKSNICYALLN